MASLYKRGKVWYIKGMLAGKRIRRAVSRDHRIAQDKLADFIKEQGAAKHNHAVTDVSWEGFKAEYMIGSKKKAANTHAAEVRAFKEFDAVAPIARLSQSTPDLLGRVMNKWIDAKRGKYVINRDVRSIRTAMHQAERWGYIAKQDWTTVKYLKTPKGRLHFLTIKELEKVKKVCRNHWLTILYLGARVGLRRSEIFWLEWSDVDFARNRIHIAPKDHWIPKDYERRWIPMPPDLRAHLEGLKSKAGRVLGDKSDIPSVGSMTNYFKRLARRAGVTASIHTLRHTFGSHYMQNGGNIYQLKQYMGHSSIKQTEIYAHLAPAEADKTLETMAGIR